MSRAASRLRERAHARARTPLVVGVVVAVLGAVLVAALYWTVRGRHLDRLSEQSRRDSEVMASVLGPHAGPEDVSEALEAFRSVTDAETIVVLGRRVVASRDDLRLWQLPDDVRADQPPATVTEPRSVDLGPGYLVVAARPSRLDARVFFLFPRDEALAGLQGIQPLFIAGWVVTVSGAVAVTRRRSRRRLRREAAARRRERELTADLAHELRTPLGAMVTAASLVDDQRDALPTAVRRPTDVLVAETRRLRHLVDDLLELARLERGQAPTDVEPVSVPDLVDAVVDARDWADVVTRDMSPAVVSANRMGLTRILINLVDNALEHGGGRAHVRVRRDRGAVQVDVQDDGPGIDPEDREHVFDRFYTIDRSRGGGSGLGLALARQHARFMDGTLTAQGRPGGGTTMTLVLPPDASGDDVSTGSAGRSRCTRPS